MIMRGELNNYPHIREALSEKPEFERYIKMVEEQSSMVATDLSSLDYILTYHTIDQIIDFMPKFISLII